MILPWKSFMNCCKCCKYCKCCNNEDKDENENEQCICCNKYPFISIEEDQSIISIDYDNKKFTRGTFVFRNNTKYHTIVTICCSNKSKTNKYYLNCDCRSAGTLHCSHKTIILRKILMDKAQLTGKKPINYKLFDAITSIDDLDRFHLK